MISLLWVKRAIIVVTRGEYCDVRILLYCKIFSRERRSTLQLGAQGGER
jgi:hypothetical protein